MVGGWDVVTRVDFAEKKKGLLILALCELKLTLTGSMGVVV